MSIFWYLLIPFSVIVILFGAIYGSVSDTPDGWLSAIFIIIIGAAIFAAPIIQYQNHFNRPAPVGWFKKLPPAELRLMHQYIKSSGKPLSVNNFEHLHRQFQKEEIRYAAKQADEQNYLHHCHIKKPVMLSPFQVQMQATNVP